MFGLGGAELAVVGLIAFLFLGPKKIPELAKGLGQGINSFKKGLNEKDDESSSLESTEDRSA